MRLRFPRNDLLHDPELGGIAQCLAKHTLEIFRATVRAIKYVKTRICVGFGSFQDSWKCPQKTP